MLDPTISTYDKIAHKYAEKHITADESFIRKYSEFLKLCKGKKILDVGCGPGRDTQYFMEKGCDVIGVDRSKGMLAEARKRFTEGDFRKMDMKELEFDSGHFDGLWANASLLHIKRSEVGKVLTEFRRVLRKGGVIFISLKEGFGDEIKVYPDGTKRFFSYYSKGEFEKLVEKDFNLIDSYTNTGNDGDVWINIFALAKF